ncbi:PKD domain-containing protein, partial [Flavobacterium sp. ASW18X]|uniref:PKD domain-containing protein n=1 Tax=Flavobacterium sp. ASW18X TaxID=2572595 RepID=UPI0010AE8871
QVVDIDNDGDLDIISTGWNTIIPRIFENKTIDANAPINESPIVQNPGLQLYNLDSEIVLQIDARDPNSGDVLSYSAVNLPSGLSIDETTGLISGTLTAAEASYFVTVRVSDQLDAFTEISFTMEVGELTPILRINAGGADVNFDGEQWVSDIYFQEGEEFNAINEIANTENDEIYQTERNSSAGESILVYEIPVPENGRYGVRLHFAEIYHNTVGARVFDVSVEGGQGTLNNYDIIATSGGQNTAVVESFAVDVNDGYLTIIATDYIDRAKISGIEILAGAENKAPIIINPGTQTVFTDSGVNIQIEANDLGDVLTYSAIGLPEDLTISETSGLISGQLNVPAATYPIEITVTDQGGLQDSETFDLVVAEFQESLYINAGGPTVNYNGQNWIADQYFNGGESDFSTTNAIANTDNDEIYQTERYNGSFNYAIPVPNNEAYRVTLHFAELFFTAAGERIFNVSIEDNQHQLDEYDVYVAAGNQEFTAVEESFIVDLTDGILNVDFESVTNFAKLSGISVTQLVKPVAVASATPISGNWPLEVSFIGNQSTDDGTIVEYLWDFKDGTTSTEQNPIHTFTSEGIYEVELVVTDNDGLQHTSTVEIEVTTRVNQNPNAIIEVDTENGFAPLTVNFDASNSTDSDGNIVSYVWDFGDGTSASGQIVNHEFVNIGEYTVTLTVVDNEDGEGIVQQIITVIAEGENLPPRAIIEANPTTGVAPLPVIFNGSNSTDQDGTILSYGWDFGDGRTSSEESPVITFQNDGVYTVTLMVTDNSGASDTTSIEIEVMANQAPLAVITTDGITGNAPFNVVFSGEDSTDDANTIVDYAWDFGDGNVASGVNVNHVFENPGEYTVTLTVTDNVGNTNFTTVTISVVQGLINPNAVITVDTQEGNAPLLINFSGTESEDSDGSIVTYSWDFGNGTTASGEIVSYEYTEVGEYIVSLTVTDNDGLTDTATAVVNIKFGLSTLTLDNEIAIIPNPASGGYTDIALDIDDESKFVSKILLHDSSGRLMNVFEAADLIPSSDFVGYRIPIGSLRDELYFVTVEFNKGKPISLQLLVKN